MSKQKLIRETDKRPTSIFKKLQEYLANAGHSLHMRTISSIIHMIVRWGRVALQKPLLTNNIQAHLSHPKPCAQICYGLMRPVELSGCNSKRYAFMQKLESSSPKEHHALGKPWSWQYHVIRLLLFS